MTPIDLDSKDVENYTNKDGLIAISDLRMLALAENYISVDTALKIIDDAIRRRNERFRVNHDLVAGSVLKEKILRSKDGEQK